jgi:hypothetical protein
VLSFCVRRFSFRSIYVTPCLCVLPRARFICNMRLVILVFYMVDIIMLFLFYYCICAVTHIC